MLQNFKFIDNGYSIGVLFIELSKAFDILNKYLFFEELDGYGFSLKSTTFTQIKESKKSMSIINSVHRRIFIVVCHRVQYVAQSSLIFSLMTFSASWLFAICVTTLMIILYILMADISIKFKNIWKKFLK